jgi:hypothetical protein
MSLQPRWVRDPQDVTNPPCRTPFDLPVPGDRCLSEVARVHPDVVTPAVVMQKAPVRAQMSFEIPSIHRSFLVLSHPGRRQATQEFGT